MGALIAGARYKDEFEEGLNAVINEVVSSNGEIVKEDEITVDIKNNNICFLNEMRKEA